MIKGREALRTYFRGYIEMLGDIVVESTDKFAETDDAILFEATVRSKLGGPGSTTPGPCATDRSPITSPA